MQLNIAPERYQKSPGHHGNPADGLHIWGVSLCAYISSQQIRTLSLVLKIPNTAAPTVDQWNLYFKIYRELPPDQKQAFPQEIEDSSSQGLYV